MYRADGLQSQLRRNIVGDAGEAENLNVQRLPGGQCSF